MKEVEEGNCCFLNLILNSRFSFGLETTKFGVYLLCLHDDLLGRRRCGSFFVTKY